MDTNTKPEAVFLPPRHAAIRLGVPAAWFEREVKAGRVPSLKAGTRTLIDIDAAREALTRRAGEGVKRGK